MNTRPTDFQVASGTEGNKLTGEKRPIVLVGTQIILTPQEARELANSLHRAAKEAEDSGQGQASGLVIPKIVPPKDIRGDE